MDNVVVAQEAVCVVSPDEESPKMAEPRTVHEGDPLVPPFLHVTALHAAPI